MRMAHSFAEPPYRPTCERFSGKPKGDNRDTGIRRSIEVKGPFAVFQKTPRFDVTPGLLSTLPR